MRRSERLLMPRFSLILLGILNERRVIMIYHLISLLIKIELLIKVK